MSGPIKERPILMSGIMVRPTLSGAKTQTRRVQRVKVTGPAHLESRCPYGAVGDRLWVREAFSPHRTSESSLDYVVFRDGGQKFKDDGRYFPGLAKYAPGAFDGFRIDYPIPMPVGVECAVRGYPNYDADGKQQYENTHFDTEEECWNKLEVEAKAGVSLDARSVKQIRSQLHGAEQALVESALVLNEVFREREKARRVTP